MEQMNSTKVRETRMVKGDSHILWRSPHCKPHHTNGDVRLTISQQPPQPLQMGLAATFQRSECAGFRYYAKSTPIKRQVKVKGEANPYDPAYETYFEEREGAHMLDTFRGTRTLRYLWHEQRGLCTLCNTKITRITGWRLHYCLPRVKGGSIGATNCVLLHPECHDRVHRQRLSVSKPRLL